MIIRRAQIGGLTLLVTFTVVATVTWYCDAEPLVATYAFQKSGLFGSDLTITLG